MTGTEWIEAFARRLGIDAPDQATVDALLDVASTAAHGSERLAAPIACYLIGRADANLEAASSAAAAIGT